MLLTRREARATDELHEAPAADVADAPVRTAARSGRWRAWRRERPLVGGILLIVGGVEMFASSQLDFGRLHIHLGIEGLQALIIPAALIALGALVIATPSHRMLYGIVALAIAVYSIVGVNLGGFLIGFVLAAVGGILTVSWMPRGPAAAGELAESAGPEDGEPA